MTSGQSLTTHPPADFFRGVVPWVGSSSGTTDRSDSTFPLHPLRSWSRVHCNRGIFVCERSSSFFSRLPLSSTHKTSSSNHVICGYSRWERECAMLSGNSEKVDIFMPVYDVACSLCGYAGTATVKISELASWDAEALCPQCKKGDSSFRRIIKSAPASTGSASFKPEFKSSDRDDMRHKEHQRRNPDQVAAAIESVRKGTNEGFT